METYELYQAAKDIFLSYCWPFQKTDLCASNQMQADATSEWIVMWLTEKQTAEYTWHMS